MIGRKQRAWTSSEFFAHKKNVGEEAKLRGTLSNIDKQSFMMRESLRHEMCDVKTALTNLRKSTGHSIDALPPTPFRFEYRKFSIMPLVTRDSCSTLIPSEHNKSMNDLDRDIREVLINNNPENDSWDERQKEFEPVKVDEDVRNSWTDIYVGDNVFEAKTAHRTTNKTQDNNHTMRRTQDTSREILQAKSFNNVDLKAKKSAFFSEQTSGEEIRFPAIVTKTPNLVCVSKSVNGISSDGQNNDRKTESETEISTITPLSALTRNTGINTEQDRQLYQISSTSHTSPSRTELFISPLSREITEVLKEGEQKRRSYVRKNSFMGLDEKVTALLTEKNDVSANNSKAQFETNKSNAGKSKVQQKGKNGNRRDMVLQDARTRCRTCMERFRLNVQYHKQRLKAEKDAEKAANMKHYGQKSVENMRLRENSTFFLSEDVESLFSEEVLDFGDNDDKAKPRSWRHRRPKNGYSRKRMEELAEPRKGCRRRFKFSRQVIKKEMESLAEKHSLPQLTDVEKERLRVLESKIRTFLARMQSDLTPATMVHIPEREDIMKVDISHL